MRINQFKFVLLVGTLLLITSCEDDTPAPGSGIDAGLDNDSVGGDLGADESGTDSEGERDGFNDWDTPGTGFRDLAGEFIVETLDGPWDFRASWTGYDAYVFAHFTDNPSQSADLVDYLNNMWFPDGSSYEEMAELIALSPLDTHYIFGSYDDDAAEDMARAREGLEVALTAYPENYAAYWRDRVHFVSVPLGEVTGWYFDILAAENLLWFGIDTEQRVRQVGLTSDILTNEPRLSLLAYEAQYYIFERDRGFWLDELDATTVSIFSGESVGSATAEALFPSAEEMAEFDKMYYDFTAFCPDHDDVNCGEWDTGSSLSICDYPQEAENPHLDVSCQPYVAGVTEVEEVLGTCALLVTDDSCDEDDTCPEGSSCSGYIPETDDTDEVMGVCLEDTAACSVDADCTEAQQCMGYVAESEEADEQLGACMNTCLTDDDCLPETACGGYVAPVSGIEEIPADVLPCECMNPNNETVDAEYICNGEGTGYQDCNCACSTEIGRWITTYGREGRWITDVTPMLSMLRRGGPQRFSKSNGNTYDTWFDVLLVDTGAEEEVDKHQFLWGGKAFDEFYNEGREPIVFTVEEGVTRVELVALTTGHGFGNDAANCAEFCNHTHHFYVNGDEYVEEHPEAETRDGCMTRVGEGVVPNQYGTWPYGRSGWCPGWDVFPWVVDITESLVEGENTISYEGFFWGEPYFPDWLEDGTDFSGSIWLSSYLVYWK